MTERSPGTRYAERTKRRAQRLYVGHGWSMARISRELDVGLGTVRRWVAEVAGSDGNQRRYDRAAILADAAENPASSGTLSRAEILAKYQCSPRFLSNLLAGKLKP